MDDFGQGAQGDHPSNKISGGFYLKARCVQESWIANAPPHVREIWDWLLMKANFKDRDKLKRGQVLTSYKEIQDGLAWYVGYRKETYKKHHCERAMKALKKATMVATTKTTRGIIVTILNYDKYQDPENYESYTKDDTKATMKLQCVATIQKKEKKGRKEEGNTTAKKANGTICPHQKIIEEYNNTLSDVLPKVKPNLWGGERSKRLAARWNENKERQNIEWWRSYFSKVKDNTFLLGENERGWKADIHWLLNLDNMAKVVEGKYEQKKKEVEEWV